MMNNGSKTISEIRRFLVAQLSKLFSENEAASTTRLILEHVGFNEYAILKEPSVQINSKTQSEITKIVYELKKNRPIQYILGQTSFMDLSFLVDEQVLIPRSETEELVSRILSKNKVGNPRIIDIGCGSGCIAIALAHYIPNSIVSAMDIDAGALRLAKKNALLNHVKVNFIHQSIFETETAPQEDPYDIIISNPPYVTPADKLSMLPNVTDYEPDLALYVPIDDPLVFYKEIIKFSKNRLSDSGEIWVEINENFGNETKQLFLDAGYKDAELLEDIHGKDRFIKIMK
ncbi:MAG: peptide chain release factor N(5)-glutamine methyltransferase [Bacteroidales bacterium]